MGPGTRGPGREELPVTYFSHFVQSPYFYSFFFLFSVKNP